MASMFEDAFNAINWKHKHKDDPPCERPMRFRWREGDQFPEAMKTPGNMQGETLSLVRELFLYEASSGIMLAVMERKKTKEELLGDK